MGTPGEPSARNARAFLARSQNPDGGWGYRPGSPSATEPTGAALVALGPDPEAAPAVERARRWLEAAQRPDGGWGMDPEDPESHWMTAWGILGLARLDPHALEITRGVRWLIELPVIRIEAAELTAEVRRTLRIDPALRGWPWRPGEASWVEPTALALLALHAASAVEAHRDRIAEAVGYLVDRRCVGGGWNFGNPFMLGANLPPRPHPTASAIRSRWASTAEAAWRASRARAVGSTQEASPGRQGQPRKAGSIRNVRRTSAVSSAASIRITGSSISQRTPRVISRA